MPRLCDLCHQPVRWWTPARIMRPGYALVHSRCLRTADPRELIMLRYLAMSRDWDGQK